MRGRRAVECLHINFRPARLLGNERDSFAIVRKSCSPLREAVLQERREGVVGLIRDPGYVLFLADAVIQRDEAAIRRPVRGQSREMDLFGLILERLRRAITGEVEEGKFWSADRGGSPEGEAGSVGRPDRAAMDLR